MAPLLRICLLIVLWLLPQPADAAESTRQLLVTFKNEHANYQSAAFQPPYRARKRYAVSAVVRRHAQAIAKEYALTELEQWPLASLSIYCYVFEVDVDQAKGVVAALSKDARVESAQWLNTFRTESVASATYNDAYVGMQHGLDTISLAEAHRFSRGAGTRVAVVDSDADDHHEDLDGSITRTDYLAHANIRRDRRHGTAVASVIGANANNAVGIVGVAPDARIEVAEACWLDEQLDVSICDTFSLAKALDGMFRKPPDIVNLSLSGPDDPLLGRILRQLVNQGVLVIAAASVNDGHISFPASMPAVVPVTTIGNNGNALPTDTLFAPGDRILVAVPSNDYGFKSGTSLATAHVSGVAALLLARFPDMPAAKVRDVLSRSQSERPDGRLAINACRAFELAEASLHCDDD